MKTFLALFIMLGSLTVQASNYPGDYAIKGNCQTQGAVRVCRALQPMYNLAVLDITYTGELKSSQNLSVWVRVNYSNGSKEILVPMKPVNGGDLYTARITGGCLEGRLGGCEKTGTAEMRDLLSWAQQYGGALNALDLDIAFVDADGTSDSNGRAFGSYHFTFPQN